MKKFLCVLLILSMALVFVACEKKPVEPDPTPGGDDTPEEDPWKTAKIAIITNTVSQNEEEYRSAEFVQNKYGKDKIVHELWPDNFMTEQEQMITVLTKLADDPAIKAIIINQAVPGTNPAVDKFKEMRSDDVLIVYASPQENAPDVSVRADFILQPDELAMGTTIPNQAKRQGAKTLVHYSFPRHMSIPMLAERRDLMRTECEKIGLTFVDETAPDPTGEGGVAASHQFILEDVPKKVTKYGKDTSFFSTNCSMQVPLIKAAFDNDAIYSQPCCPSPYHGFPSALELKVPDDIVGGLQDVIDKTTEKIVAAGLGGRFSTWPVPAAMMATIASAEYAVKWIKGETNGKVDLKVLEQCMADYAGMEITLNPYVESGVTYNNYLFFLMDFLTYGDLPEQE